MVNMINVLVVDQLTKILFTREINRDELWYHVPVSNVREIVWHPSEDEIKKHGYNGMQRIDAIILFV